MTHRRSAHRCTRLFAAAGRAGPKVLAAWVLASVGAQASAAPEFTWETELLSMDLTGSGVMMPLGPGWSPMLVDLVMRESAALHSTGAAAATRSEQDPNGPVQDGDEFLVGSSFDVFFELGITDVDPLLDFLGQQPGTTLSYVDNGPARIENLYVALADLAAPNLGLLPPPESAPYVGMLGFEIPLGIDLDGNGELDKIKFGISTFAVADTNRTFIVLPDLTVINNFDLVADITGSIVDLQDDPPFGPITLTGPATASSRPTGPDSVPEPSLLALLGMGLAGFGLTGRRAARRP